MQQNNAFAQRNNVALKMKKSRNVQDQQEIGIQFINEMDSMMTSGGVRLFSESEMTGTKRSCLDNSEDSSDSDSEGILLPHDLLGVVATNNRNVFADGPKPGKKTKGRVKIKMEFIENKLRRYTTFSKRKTGIMKKAYELSTLTGTQVMLLVASETGHVYTFATRKLQPMITSESGKALIQTCLNSPDSPLDIGKHSNDQRMNPTGFEETDLSYAVSEDEGLQPMALSSSPYTIEGVRSTTTTTPINKRCPMETSLSSSSAAAAVVQSVSSSSHHPLLYQLSQDLALSSRPTTSEVRPKQEPLATLASYPNGQGQARSIDTGHTSLNRSSMPSTSAASSSANSSHQNQQCLSISPQHTFYKIPGTNQIISLSFPGAGSGSQGPMLCQSYSTPSSIGSIQEGLILNLPQTLPMTTPLEMSPSNTSKQLISVPIPLSLTKNSQMFHPLLSPSTSVKSEMLPTDLRYRGIEKTTK